MDRTCHAVIVGVSEYYDQDRLLFPPADAIRLANVIQKYAAFDEVQAHLLVNGEQRAQLPNVESPTRAAILDILKRASTRAQEGSLLLFFFAGHGAEVSGVPYLLTQDTRMNVLNDTAIGVKKVNSILEGSRASCVLKVFDACRNSPQMGSRSIALRMTQGLQDAMAKIGKGWAAFRSCSSGEVAHEPHELGQGLFSYYLCEGLEGKAADDNGEVDLMRLVAYVEGGMNEWCRRESLVQTPHFIVDLSGVTVLTRVKGPSKTKPQSSAKESTSLQFLVDAHLAQVAEDTRGLTVTDGAQLGTAAKVLKDGLAFLIEELAHPLVSISVTEPAPLENWGDVSNQFLRDRQQYGVHSEYREPSMAFQISSQSTNVALPDWRLTVGVARFSFFYWLWYYHEFSRQKLGGSFRPSQTVFNWYSRLSERAILDPLKAEGCMRELLGHLSEHIRLWEGELRQYLESKVEPMRQMGPLID